MAGGLSPSVSGEQYRIASPPAWVVPVAFESPDDHPLHESPGFRYLLVDRQRHIEEQSAYTHIVSEILDAESLRDLSNLAFDFDPSYQTLILHEVSVIRGDQQFDRLLRQSISVMRRETSMEWQVYDGQLTAVINLRDIRIGDIIEHAYSIVGDNPVLQGHYAGDVALQFPMRVDRIHLRLLASNRRTMFFQPFNSAELPARRRQGELTEYVWDLRDIDVAVQESGAPLWYEPSRHVAISDMGTWEEVVDFGIGLFASSEDSRARLHEAIAPIIDHPSLDSVIVRAIRFTQDEIRYLAFVDGMYSHQPRPPLTVLEQRYGDCKDKSLLLTEILRGYGIEASPVLVNSFTGFLLPEYPASPLFFDHCVVQLDWEGTEYYVDPTISNQGGDLQHLFFPRYHWGLVLRPDQAALTEIPISDHATTRIRETFVLDSVGGGAELSIVSTYTGLDADLVRNQMSGVDPGSVQQSYVEYYGSVYPGIAVAGKMEIADQRSGVNTITLRESYRIANMWRASTRDTSILECEFVPLPVMEYTEMESSPARTSPYQVPYPVDIEHETILRMPTPWYVRPKTEEIDRDAFRYRYDVSYTETDTAIRIVRSYQTKRSHIEADEAAAYVADHAIIRNSISYVLTFQNLQAAGLTSLGWVAMYGLLIVTVLGICLSVMIFNRFDLPPVAATDRPRRLGGWLIPVAIGFTLMPFVRFIQLTQATTYFDFATWSIFFSPDATAGDFWLGASLFLEASFRILWIIACILAAVLLYHRRTTFPRVGMVVLVSSPIFGLLERLMLRQFQPQLYEGTGIAYEVGYALGSMAFSIAVVLYLLLSRRVAETFVMRSPRASVDRPLEATRARRPIGATRARAMIIAAAVMIVGVAIIAMMTRDMTPEIPADPGHAVSADSSLTIADGEAPGDESLRYAIIQCVRKDGDRAHLKIIAVANRTEAESILVELANGSPFADLAGRFSTHASRSNGGDLGMCALNDLDEPFRVAIERLEEGRYSGILELD